MSQLDLGRSDPPVVDLNRKKRLGQFFTGAKLARLLAAMSSAQSAKTIIDPMGGSGDMLTACLEIADSVDTCVSVEVDPIAIAAARERNWGSEFRTPTFVQGDAFNPTVIASLPQQSFDLVITNPPYVRYQSLSKQFNGDIKLPSSVEIRSNLLRLLEHLPQLDKRDRQLFQTLIGEYSGLSDLAVPAWMLCALLTKVGGKLAMVVPESWLTRDYAQVIQYLLLRWFRIEFVVEDVHAVWFPDALVKTTLLIAERIERKSSAFIGEDQGYMHVRIDGQAMGSASVIGRIYPGEDSPEQIFATRLKKMFRDRHSSTESMFSANWTPLSHQIDALKRNACGQRWLRSAEDSPVVGNRLEDDAGPVLPAPLARWFEASAPQRFLTLEEAGARVGQGLRTGANRFFYVECTGYEGDDAIVVPDPIFGLPKLRVPANAVIPVLRKQSELQRGFALDSKALTGRVLDLHTYALPEDLAYKRELGVATPYSRMPAGLATLVRIAATTNVGTEPERKNISDLSAVRTNARRGPGSSPLSAPRFWYMLPPFTPRHMPNLFVARVNSAHPKTVLNGSKRLLIDANFSTFWLERGSQFDRYGFLALLNSSWCVTCMELMGSVMGGGALKLEAAHLRRLPIPKMTPRQRLAMSTLGKSLVSQTAVTHNALYEIDRLVVEALFPVGEVEKVLLRLDELKKSHMKARSRKRP
jgi:hypothetical protein